MTLGPDSTPMPTMNPSPTVLELDAFADGAWIFRFDGRVLQIFGYLEVYTASHSIVVDSWSIHVRQLIVKVAGPDKHGAQSVMFCSITSEKRCPDRGILKLTYTESTDPRWTGMLTFLADLRTAGANVYHVT